MIVIIAIYPLTYNFTFVMYIYNLSLKICSFFNDKLQM
jgi:hypothetical protein